MAVEFTQGDHPRPDKIGTIETNASLLKAMFDEPVSDETFDAVSEVDDAKYFFVNLPETIRKRLKPHPLHIVLKNCLPPYGHPSNPDITALVNRNAVDLFQIARLHFSLTSDLLDADAREYVELQGLRDGIRPGWVVPSLRHCNPVAFTHTLNLTGMRHASIAHFINGSEKVAETLIDELKNGYTGKGGKRWTRAGDYRITRHTAVALHEALNQAAKRSSADIPSLDQLFPVTFPIGLQHMTKPLPVSQGNRLQ